jgi:predicted Zn finger-like uncharacterized protein
LAEIHKAPAKSICIFWLMRKSEPIQFFCPHCGAEYNIMIVDRPLPPQREQVLCVRCDVPLPSADGHVALKYVVVRIRPDKKRFHSLRTAYAGQ